MASPKKPTKGDPPRQEGEPAPWRTRGIKGVVPPGRRVSDEPRRARWSASGVEGVAPPGKQKPGEGPVIDWLTRGDKKSKRKNDTGPGRPTAGFVPDADAGEGDPKDIKSFIDLLVEFFQRHHLDEETAAQVVQLIAQSHAPFEILAGFAALTGYVGQDNDRRRLHQWALERGAKVYYNLAKRLDPAVRPPRGLVPRSVDPLFYDLPRTAMQIPFAYATGSFLHVLEVFRMDHVHNRELIRFAKELRTRFHERRSFGDRALTDLFPWTEPDWSPE